MVQYRMTVMDNQEVYTVRVAIYCPCAAIRILGPECGALLILVKRLSWITLGIWGLFH